MRPGAVRRMGIVRPRPRSAIIGMGIFIPIPSTNFMARLLIASAVSCRPGIARPGAVQRLAIVRTRPRIAIIGTLIITPMTTTTSVKRRLPIPIT